MSAFAAALAQASSGSGAEWMLHVEQPELVNDLQVRGLRTTAEAPVHYAFIGF